MAKQAMHEPPIDVKYDPRLPTNRTVNTNRTLDDRPTRPITVAAQFAFIGTPYAFKINTKYERIDVRPAN